MRSRGKGDRICNGCGHVRAAEEFSFRNKAAGKRHLQCRLCCRALSKRHYALNRTAYLERNRRNTPRHRLAAKQWVLEYLLEHPCISCGEAEVVVLEFNHRDPTLKTANLADMIWAGASRARVHAEISRCDVLCANCHQRLTSLGRAFHYKLGPTRAQGSTLPAFRKAANLRNHRLVLEYLALAACADCSERDPLVLQFDHRGQKTKDIGWLVGSGSSPRHVALELTKCDVRCANCHRRRTAKASGWFRARISA